MTTASTFARHPLEGLAQFGALAGQSLRVLRAVLRNPLEALPPEVYREPILARRVLHRNIVHVMAPELIHQALVTEGDKLDKGDSVRRPLGPALGEGLLIAEGADWRWQRRALAPIFRPAQVQSFLPAMLEAARRSAARLRAVPPGQAVAIEQETMRATFDVIVETMLSGPAHIDVDRAAADITEYLRLTHWANIASLLRLPDWAPYPGRRRGRRAVGYLRGRLMAQVAARRADGAARGDLIDLLLEASDPETGQRMDDTQITDNLVTFLTAGHETTALGLAWTLDLLGRHPAIARRAVAEVDAVTGGSPVLPEHVARLDYVKQVFQEAMRLYPPVPILARRVAEPFALGGTMLWRDTALFIPIHAVHRHETLWEAPHVFDPDRFGPEQVAARHRHAFMPFGAGPRLCIGGGFAMLEAVAILGVLLREIRFTSAEAVAPAPRVDITLRPSSPLRMTVAARRG
ncbi:cytochrome P450 [Pseudoroseomonas wenyumeiae]|uniref:Cytochrome P450 n=1 Tax=Teichococcus wenyumeiae TaxID=2478470 RepID=A0A3A9J337_9PROT|nr:cytochrome P450 [Pseudoroseomonas wenyumeiae]RKK01617.1 cytochrome P450 [Pseudoroseomonas wenyumeiae]RMI26624.1 cytochrome P450 [Pseudoroseomonas wenyumeiae]